MSKKIVLATSNKGKVKEYEEMLSPLGYEILSNADFPNLVEKEENGIDYKANALIKALALREITSLPILADDSGLEILSLNNFPGLHTGRFAKNKGSYAKAWEEIFERLEGKKRDARFVCTICYLGENSSEPHYFEGICPGEILFAPHGDNGFGYDPIFHSYEANIDFGIASEEIKNTYSHRGKALQKLRLFLEGK